MFIINFEQRQVKILKLTKKQWDSNLKQEFSDFGVRTLVLIHSDPF
jgi:hypothetical protein